MSRFSEKVALVTGANRRIGLQVAKDLAGLGFRVFVGSRDAEAGAKAAREVGPRAEALTIDVADTTGVRRAAEEFGARSGRLDVLVNNAGIYPDGEVTILDVPRETLDLGFATNVFGPIGVAQAFLPMLRASGAGRVVNVSSGYGQLDGMSPDAPSYCLSKLALNGSTILLASKLKPAGIVVNSVCPGWVRTDMGGPNASRSVEQGADTIVWLASEAPGDVTGKFFRDRKEIPW